MNTHYDDTPADDPRFDRLVDGELSEPQRRELLAGLDNEPGGWRRCALAFLEAQCWNQAMGDVVRTGVISKGPVKALRSGRSPWLGRLGTLAAMAACFLVAFWVGSAVRQSHVAPVVPGGEVAVTTAPRPTPVISKSPERSLASMAAPRPADSSPWRMVTVAAPAGSALRVPAVERNRLDPDEWLRSLPPAIPEDVMGAFARTGHRVDQQRELVPVSLQDGRHLIVPVDKVNVHYVGNQTY